MTPTPEDVRKARDLIRNFGLRSDCEASVADCRWLQREIVTALTQARAEGQEKERKKIADELETNADPTIQSIGKAIRKGWHVGREATPFA